jgi:hypothetical protein
MVIDVSADGLLNAAAVIVANVHVLTDACAAATPEPIPSTFTAKTYRVTEVLAV